MKPLTERLLGIRPATVTILGQFSGARGELVQGAASLCSWIRARRVIALSGARFRTLSTEPGVQLVAAPWLSVILSLALRFAS